MYFKGIKRLLLVLCGLAAFAAQAKDVAGYGSTKGLSRPVCFVENKGQLKDDHGNLRTDIGYKLTTPGVSLYLGGDHLLYQFRQHSGTDANSLQFSSYEVQVSLLGANKHAHALNLEPQQYHENYYTGADHGAGFTANAFDKVVYKDVYPGIDWVVYTKEGKVEYDFVVNAGGNPADIRIQYLGVNSLKSMPDGGIIAETPMGTIVEHAPLAFENNTGRKVSSRFQVDNDVITFATGKYQGTLTIDPYLSWSTYFGGTSEDVATSVISYGGTGLIYAAGYTSSNAGIAVGVGLPFNTFGGVYDAFIAAYSAAGVMSWATYFGGTADDRGTGLAADAGGNLYLTGYSSSTGIGTAGTYQPNYIAGNGVDAYLVKFSGTGVRQWSTYFGGTGDDYANAVACDPGGNVYIAGQTNSATGISSGGVFQNTLSGTNDGFFAKFTTTGALVFASYFGGSGQDGINAIACDASGNFVFTGQTNSINVISSAGGYQLALSGTNDAFIESFSSTGARNWGTYSGGTGTESGSAVVCDAGGKIAVTGNTTSGTGMATANAYQSTFGGVQDGFVAQFSFTGALNWSTYFGGNQADYATGICMDPQNNIAICGYTLSNIGIATAGALQTSIGGSFDAYVTKFDPYGRNLWASYFGGTFNDNANGITIDATGLLTLAGSTGSTGLFGAGGIASSATVQQPTNAGGASDGFVAQLTADTLVMIQQPFTDTLVCAGGALVVSYTSNFAIAAATLSVQLSDASGVFPASSALGIIGSVTGSLLAGTINCTIPSGLTGTGFRIRILSNTPNYTSPDDNYNIHIVTTLPAPSLTANTPICVGQTLSFQLSSGYIMSSFAWTGPNAFVSILQSPTIPGVVVLDAGKYFVAITHNGCPTLNDSIAIVVNSVIPATPTATIGSPACMNYPVTLYANPGAGAGPFTYSWSGPGGYTATGMTVVRIDTAGTAVGTYTLIDTLGGCPSLPATIIVTLTANSTVSIVNNLITPSSTTICKGDSAVFTTTILNGGPDPVYQWYRGVPDTQIIGAIWETWSSSAISDGEQIYCVLTSDAVCAYPLKATSNVITLHVADSTPVAYITVVPDSDILPGANVTFNAYAFYPGTITVFQWYVDDTLVPAANAPTFTLMGVTAEATVKLQVFTPSKCARPDTAFSNVIGLHFNTGVVNISDAFRNIELYPNPASTMLNLTGGLSGYAGNTVDFEIVNTIGQTVKSGTIPVKNNEIKQSISLDGLSNGIYMIRLGHGAQSRISKFAVAR